MNKFIANIFAYINGLLWFVTILAILIFGVHSIINEPDIAPAITFAGIGIFFLLLAFCGLTTVFVAKYELERENSEVLKAILNQQVAENFKSKENNRIEPDIA